MGQDIAELDEMGNPIEEAPKKRIASKVFATLFSATLLVGLAGVFLFQFVKTIPTVKDEYSKVSYPIVGKFVKIENIDGAWQRTDEMKAVAVQQLKLDEEIVSIPNAIITIGANTKDSNLRVLFANDRKRYVGDPINLEVRNGIFTSTGNRTINLLCSEGFDNEGDFRAYKQGIIMRWSVDILEGAASSSSISDYTKIVSQEIQALYR